MPLNGRSAELSRITKHHGSHIFSNAGSHPASNRRSRQCRQSFRSTENVAAKRLSMVMAAITSPAPKIRAGFQLARDCIAAGWQARFRYPRSEAAAQTPVLHVSATLARYRGSCRSEDRVCMGSPTNGRYRRSRVAGQRQFVVSRSAPILIFVLAGPIGTDQELCIGHGMIVGQCRKRSSPRCSARFWSRKRKMGRARFRISVHAGRPTFENLSRRAACKVWRNFAPATADYVCRPSVREPEAGGVVDLLS